MISTDDLQQVVHELGGTIGFELELIEESVFGEGEFASATARSPRRSEAARLVSLEMLAKIQISPGTAGGAACWVVKGWEADIYEEWTGLERLADEDAT